MVVNLLLAVMLCVLLGSGDNWPGSHSAEHLYQAIE